jgi:hypothetical protein
MPFAALTRVLAVPMSSPELSPSIERELDRLPLRTVFAYLITRMKIRDGQLQITARGGEYERTNVLLPIDARR